MLTGDGKYPFLNNRSIHRNFNFINICGGAILGTTLDNQLGLAAGKVFADIGGNIRSKNVKAACD